jgi:hypothetical protein
MTVVEVTALVTLFNQMLGQSTTTILSAMADNSRMASERWAHHDAQLAENTKRVTDRFASIDAELQTTANALAAWLSKEHDEDVRMDARIKPITGSVSWLVLHWKELALLLLGIATFVNLILNSLQVGIIDPHLQF